MSGTWVVNRVAAVKCEMDELMSRRTSQFYVVIWCAMCLLRIHLTIVSCAKPKWHSLCDAAFADLPALRVRPSRWPHNVCTGKFDEGEFRIQKCITLRFQRMINGEVYVSISFFCLVSTGRHICPINYFAATYCRFFILTIDTLIVQKNKMNISVAKQEALVRIEMKSMVFVTAKT